MQAIKFISTIATGLFILSCGGTGTPEALAKPRQLCMEFHPINHSNYPLLISFSPQTEDYPSPQLIEPGDNKVILYMCTLSTESEDFRLASTILDEFSGAIVDDMSTTTVYSGVNNDDWVIISNSSGTTKNEIEMTMMFTDDNLDLQLIQ